MNTLYELQVIFREVFGDDKIILSRETTMNDIEAWDSLTHLQLIIRIEKRFHIKFTTAQMKKMSNVGDMIDAITINSGE